MTSSTYCAREPESLLADAAHRHAVRKDADALERHALLALQRLVHGRRILGLDADDLDARIERLHVGTDPCDQAAAAHRHEDRVDVARALAQDFHADRALACDDVGIVERMDEDEVALPLERQRPLVRLVVVVAVQDHLGAQVHHRLHLDMRRGLRHHDDGGNGTLPRRERHALRVVAGGGADHATLGRSLRQVRDLVVGAAQLERKDRLQVLALEQHVVAQPA